MSFSRVKNVEDTLSNMMERVRSAVSEGEALDDGSVVLELAPGEQIALLDAMLIAGRAMQECAGLSYGDPDVGSFRQLMEACLCFPQTEAGIVAALRELRDPIGPFCEFHSEYVGILERDLVSRLLDIADQEQDEPEEVSCPGGCGCMLLRETSARSARQ